MLHIQLSAQNRNRTSDTRIFSPLLYQLSYLGIDLTINKSSSGDRIWTYDLRVMSPTSFQTAPPRDAIFKKRNLGFPKFLLRLEGGGFEPPKRKAADLQSVPFGHSGILPLKSRCSDSNREPADYKSAALPIEPHRHLLGPTGLEPVTLCL